MKRVLLAILMIGFAISAMGADCDGEIECRSETTCDSQGNCSSKSVCD